ncbi:MAG: hypothetical protein AB7Q97_18365 [Gammaproteobacteria bacterium]
MKRMSLLPLISLLAVAPIQSASALATTAVHNSADASFNDSDSSVAGTASAESSTSFLLDPPDIAAGIYTAAATANTRRGSLHGLASATLAGAYSRSYRIDTFSQLEDTLFFSHEADVTVEMHVVGSFSALTFGGLVETVSTLSATGTGAASRLQTHWNGGGSTFTFNAQGETEVVYAGPLGVDARVRKTIHVAPGFGVFLTAALELIVSPPSAGGSVEALFGDTAQLSIVLPEGVTFTSQSGAFLADAPAPVPVPPALALLAAPLAALRGTRARHAASGCDDA